MSVINVDTIHQDHHLADLLRTQEGQSNIDLEPSRYFRWKGILDRVLAAALLIPGLPLIGLLVLLVRLTSRGPGLYRQVRVGQGGRTFKIYKIRTMALDAEAGTGPTWSGEDDPRITAVGRVLRKLHLDELPQLFNVLKGEMSLVGPRPERPEFVHVLAKEIPGYVNRLTVPPGVTGLAQINLPPDTDLDSVRRKLVLDLEYGKRAGVLLDTRMLLCTSMRLLGFSGDLAAHVMKLHREVTLPGRNGSSRTSAVPAGAGGPNENRQPGVADNTSGNGPTGSHAACQVQLSRKPR